MLTNLVATQHVPLMAGGRLDFVFEAPAFGTQTLSQFRDNFCQMIQAVFPSRCVEERLLFQFSERELRLFEKALRVGQLTQLLVAGDFHGLL
jgi:hypothetical protein